MKQNLMGYNLCNWRPKIRKRNRAEEILEKIMTNNFPKLRKDINPDPRCSVKPKNSKLKKKYT